MPWADGSGCLPSRPAWSRQWALPRRRRRFPTKAVHLFVPYPAGGAVDILARTLGDELSKNWGQPVIIENRPGAGGVVASQALATSAPDGYTLIVVASGHATNPFLYPKIPYDTFKDFTPICLLASSPNILLVRADSPFKTLADLSGAGARKTRQPVLRHGRQRHLDASRRRVAEKSRQGRDRRDSLQGRRSSDERSAGWANSDVVQQRAGVGGTYQRRHGSRARRHDRKARAVPARCSHHGRGGRGRLRYRRVVGSGRAGRDAGDMSWRNCRAISSPR